MPAGRRNQGLGHQKGQAPEPFEEQVREQTTEPGDFLEQNQYAPLGHELRQAINERFNGELDMQMIHTRAAQYYLNRHEDAIEHYQNLIRSGLTDQARAQVNAIADNIINHVIRHVITVQETQRQIERMPQFNFTLTRENVAIRIRDHLTYTNEEDVNNLQTTIDNLGEHAMLVFGLAPIEEGGTEINIFFFDF